MMTGRNGYKLAVFDLDGTLTTEKSIWKHIHQALGTWENNAAAFQRLFHQGAISYEEFCERDAMVWKGMRIDDLKAIADSVTYQDGVSELIAFLRGKGLRLAAVSSGLSILARRIERDLTLDFSVANDLLVEKGIVTGKVRINVGHDGKGYWMKKLMGLLGVQSRDIIAIGDSQGDLDMFSLAGFRVAFNSSSTELDETADAVVGTASMADIIQRLPL
jgi:phosphoserine phosphatase